MTTFPRASIIALSLPLCAGATVGLAQTDLLPDIIINESHLYDNRIVEGSPRLLRLSNGTANIGTGRLHLYGGTSYPNGTQDVNQRVYRTDGSWWDRTAGQFIYHPTHSHIHFDNWCNYHIREILPGDGVGPILATGGKVSFCILDLSVYDSALPGFRSPGYYAGCGSTIQGLTPGWEDIYSSGLDGQSIDITGIAPGEYWLESVVDPANDILEASESNNAARIRVTITTPGGGTLTPDRFEPNNTFAETASRPIGQPSSPNLGPVGPLSTWTGINVHSSSDRDFYRFVCNATGTSADSVRIDFNHSAGDIDMRLLNSAGAQVASSEGTSNSEIITLSGRAKGQYTLEVYGYNGDTGAYSLTINPPANAAPSATVVNPPAGNVNRIHSIDTYTVTWTSSDPENDERWVTIYLNTSPTLNGQQILMPTSVNTPAALGSYVINSAYVSPGTYWVYAEVTDGGTKTGAWSQGTVSFVEPCASDFIADGVVDDADFVVFAGAYEQFTIPPADPRCDLTGDGFVDDSDFVEFAQAYEAFLCE